VTYPSVEGEYETIRKVLEGYNLARFGDGELKMSHGYGYRRQIGSPKLAAELGLILRRPNRGCIVGIPTMNPEGPKYASWIRHHDRFLGVLMPTVQYYSAFVSRPDSAPWIETREYGELVRSIWLGKRATVLCEKSGSMYRAVMRGAKSVHHVRCPSHQAYDIISQLENEIVTSDPEVVIMSCGPTATCLANRLAGRGVHAIDLGSAGQFIMRTLAL
jgi:hypothetical protein